MYYLTDSSSPPNPTTDTDFKWRAYFDSSFDSPLTVNPHTGGDSPDYTLPNVNLNYDSIELWEAAGGYRYQMYRSAPDCLMRRQIGNSLIPIKNEKVNFLFNLYFNY